MRSLNRQCPKKLFFLNRWNINLGVESPLSYLYRQSWPTRVDMHQDIEDSLAASSISHAGGPQSPARSAENLLNGHRSKGLMELGRREETTVTDSAGPPAQARSSSSLSFQVCRMHWTLTWFSWLVFFFLSFFPPGKLCCRLGPRSWVRVWDHQGPHTIHLSSSQAENLPVQVWQLWLQFSDVRWNEIFTSTVTE